MTALALLVEAGPLGLEVGGRNSWLAKHHMVQLVVAGCAVFVRGRYVVTVKGHERHEQSRKAA